MVKKRILIAYLTILTLSLYATMVTASTGDKILSPQQPPTVPGNQYGMGFLIVTIYDHGGVEIGLEGLINPPNPSFFGVSESDALYGDIYYVFISMNPTSFELGIGVGFFGNTLNNNSYQNYADSIKGYIVNSLSTYGLILTDETRVSESDSDYTHYLWLYTFSTSNSLGNLLYQLTYDSSNSGLSEFLNVNSSWSINTYHNFIIRDEQSGEFSHIFYTEFQMDNVFQGNGTHQFSLKSLLGKTTLPLVEEGYVVIIGNPSGAQVDTESINVGSAVILTASDDLIIVQVPPNTQIDDISYTFTFDFPTQQGDGETPPSEGGDTGGTEDGTEETNLSNFMKFAPYIGIGAIVLIGAVLILLRRK